MPLRNHLKEYQVRLDVNQQQMGQLVGDIETDDQPDRAR